MKKGFSISMLILVLTSCVSKKEFKDLEQRNYRLSKKNKVLQKQIDSLIHESEYYADIFASYQYRIDSMQKVLDKASAVQSIPSVSTKKVSIPGNVSTVKTETASNIRPDMSIWNSSKYAVANTGELANYLSADEKEFLRIWNLCRLDPALFLKTYLKEIYERKPVDRSSYENSLVETLLKQPPLPVIRPDKVLFEGAKCHAYNSGKIGYIGHNRSGYSESCIGSYRAECCSYGELDPLGHFKNLMVDEGVPSLGHREAMLGDYAYAGISFQPHTKFTENVVIDMHYRKLE